MKSDNTRTYPQTGGPYYCKFRAATLLLFYLLGGEIIGEENFDPREPCFIASNHIGKLEAFWVHVCIPQFLVSIMAKIELYSTARKAKFMYSVGAFPVDRKNPGSEIIRNLKHCFENGHSVLIFPQGTRCKAFTRDTIMPGIGKFAVRFEKHVQPVHYKKIVFSFNKKKRQHLTVEFGEKISLYDGLGNKKDAAVVEEEVFQAIYAMENR